MWSTELDLAVNYGKARCLIYKMIEYEGHPIMKECIEALYEMRNAAKKSGDKTLSAVIKRILNMLYGGFGKRTYPKSVYGSK